MFNPDEIIFCVTTECNLRCPHCFVSRSPAAPDAKEAVRFLRDARESGRSAIEKVGFSGGEPFLRADFLAEVIREAVRLDFMFDRIMTNGDWWQTESGLKSALLKVRDAGYDGRICISYDTFHAQDEERIAAFIRTAWETFGPMSVEIQSVRNPEKERARPSFPGGGRASQQSESAVRMIESLARRLNLDCKTRIFRSGRGTALLSGGGRFIRAYIQTESLRFSDARAWRDRRWFKDKDCASMGQLLYVHADGSIAPCCGFANENNALLIGKISDRLDTVLDNAMGNKMIGICYGSGLSEEIRRMKKAGTLSRGRTADICTFCDLVCAEENNQRPCAKT